MPRTPIVMPQLGESIAEATIVDFLVEVGETVAADQELLEVETDKATTTVTAPTAGKVTELQVEIGESYPVGATLGQIEAAQSAPVEPAPQKPETPAPEPPPKQEPASVPPASVKPTVESLPVPAEGLGVSFISPRLKARMRELGLRQADLAGIAGSGAGGRVTIQDFESFIAELDQNPSSDASPMRVAVADAMRRSWTRPLATVGLSVCLDPLLTHRRTLTPRPGPALYALRALALALSDNRAPAGRLIGRRIAHPAAIDIGFAVEVVDGVLVPVIRQADQQPLTELTPRYQELIEQAKERRLPSDATGRSIATVTNYGTFGLTWATPIPLPEQSLVLGVGTGSKQPFWDASTESFQPRTEANLTLSFDHRVIDGGAAGRLLCSIRDLMESPDRL